MLVSSTRGRTWIRTASDGKCCSHTGQTLASSTSSFSISSSGSSPSSVRENSSSPVPHSRSSHWPNASSGVIGAIELLDPAPGVSNANSSLFVTASTGAVDGRSICVGGALGRTEAATGAGDEGMERMSGSPNRIVDPLADRSTGVVARDGEEESSSTGSPNDAAHAEEVLSSDRRRLRHGRSSSTTTMSTLSMLLRFPLRDGVGCIVRGSSSSDISMTVASLLSAFTRSLGVAGAFPFVMGFDLAHF